MARIITQELAKKIAKKLKAQIQKGGGAHDIACVYEGDLLIAQFGIRRGSEKDKGHDHIPDEIHVGPSKAKRLGQCPMSREQWLDELREKGLLPGGNGGDDGGDDDDETEEEAVESPDETATDEEGWTEPPPE